MNKRYAFIIKSGRCKHLLLPDECRCCLYHCKNEYTIDDNDYAIICQGFIHGPGKWFPKKYRKKKKRIQILSSYCDSCTKRNRCRYICSKVKAYLKRKGVYAEINEQVFLPDNESLASSLIRWRDDENVLLSADDDKGRPTKLDQLHYRPSKRKGAWNIQIHEPPILAQASLDSFNYTLAENSHPLLSERENKTFR